MISNLQVPSSIIAVIHALKDAFRFLDAHAGVISALATVAIVFLTVFYVKYSKRQWKVMQKQLDLSERPWVSADVSIAQPLVFDQRGGVTAIRVRLKNVGHSVALYVSVWTALKVGAPDPAEQEKLCAVPKSPVNADSDYGYLLFPDQQIDEVQPMIAEPNAIEQGLKGPIEGVVTLYVLICVDYRSSFDPQHHQTRLVRLLARPDAKTGAMMGSFDPHYIYHQLSLLPRLHGDSAD
jgi:hypothetical protein